MDLHHSILEYRFAEGGRKASGKLLLAGTASYRDAAMLAECLGDERAFVAEHVGIPALYDDAWAMRDDKSEDDLDFHEFVDLREATIDEILDLPVFDEVSDLLRRFIKASETRPQREELLEEA